MAKSITRNSNSNNLSYYQRNKSKLLIKRKEYREKNRNKILIQKNKYYKNNRLKIRERARNKYKNDYEYRMKSFHYSKMFRRSDKGKFFDIKNAAIKRNIEFNITFETALSFKNNNCFYCGIFVNHIGIDRVNNSLGYIEHNMVTCCTVCNRMKLAMTYNEFINQCLKISSWRNGTADRPAVLT